MTTLHITIELDGAAVCNDPQGETGRMLARVAEDMVSQGTYSGQIHLIRDRNGNCVGNWQVKA